MAVMQARQVRSNRNIATTLCLLAVVALTLGGCLLPRYRTEIAYDPQQAAFAREPGTASISGQAFLQKSSGVVVYAAGRNVILFPVTDYTSERIRLVYGNRRFLDVLFAGRQFETTDER
ncbi:MAG: hypothetical protein VYD64_01325, partial [Pseudomonadota bacterium]|nr:hypothetical protein [Pseudomonadota bacterium]